MISHGQEKMYKFLLLLLNLWLLSIKSFMLYYTKS